MIIVIIINIIIIIIIIIIITTTTTIIIIIIILLLLLYLLFLILYISEYATAREPIRSNDLQNSKRTQQFTLKLDNKLLMELFIPLKLVVIID